MAVFDTNVSAVGHINDRVTGGMVATIIEEYLDEPITAELSDKIMAHVQRIFGENHPAKVNLDDETGEIEIIVEDRNGKFIKCSSLKLFPKKYA